MKIRHAKKEDMIDIYMMGFDTWSDGMTKESYLESCANSPKYKNGTWWVLENSQKTLVSSLIIYKFGNSVYGIGSLATPIEMRKRGYASELLYKSYTHLEHRLNAKGIYLYSDIKHQFYKAHGFNKLDPEFQKYESSACMLRSSVPPEELPTPEYF